MWAMSGINDGEIKWLIKHSISLIKNKICITTKN